MSYCKFLSQTFPFHLLPLRQPLQLSLLCQHLHSCKVTMALAAQRSSCWEHLPPPSQWVTPSLIPALWTQPPWLFSPSPLPLTFWRAKLGSSNLDFIFMQSEGVQHRYWLKGRWKPQLCLLREWVSPPAGKQTVFCLREITKPHTFIQRGTKEKSGAASARSGDVWLTQEGARQSPAGVSPVPVFPRVRSWRKSKQNH
jgi:hypothetical protein